MLAFFAVGLNLDCEHFLHTCSSLMVVHPGVVPASPGWPGGCCYFLGLFSRTGACRGPVVTPAWYGGVVAWRCAGMADCGCWATCICGLALLCCAVRCLYILICRSVLHHQACPVRGE